MESLRTLIRASAGTGKTFRLSGHFLGKLFEGYRPETILATTFTRKAAGEILGRVLLRLAEAADDSKAAQTLAAQLKVPGVSQESARELLRSLTRDLHRVRVCTLDSFFQTVARSLSLELGLSPGWKIIDDHIDQELREQAIDAVLAQEVPRDAQNLMQMLAKGRSKRSIRDLINETVTNYHQIFINTHDDAWTQFPSVRRITEKELTKAVASVLQLAAREDKFKSVCEGDIAKFQSGMWDGFLSKGLAPKIVDRSLTYSRKPIPPEIAAAYEPLIEHARGELIGLIARQTMATRDLMVRFDKEYKRLKSEHGWLRFSDVTRTLAHADDAARSNTLNFRLDSSIQHLLLDEFQDTSPDQWKILRRLTQAIMAQKSESSFFCVGDGKQAIYGWRGGVSEILDVVAREVPEIAAEQMNTSRRSSPAVIHSVNQVFQHIARHADLGDYEPACQQWVDRFPEHETAKEIAGYTCLRTAPELDGSNKDERSGPWFRWVAEQVAEIAQQTPNAEIGILTRKNGTVARLVHELALIGVAASEEGGTPPTDSAAVLAVMSLLHFISHPGCEVSRFHVANSPLGRVVGLTEWYDSQTAFAISATLRSQLQDFGYGRLLQSWADAVQTHCNVRDQLRLQQIIRAGHDFDEAGSLDPCDFISLLEASRFSKSEPAAIRVMTIHQSKGLEFDIVILPELDERLLQTPSAAVGYSEAGGQADRVVVWRSKEVRALLPKPLQLAFDETIHRQVSETLCTLYVAMTRAVHALHMLIQPSPKPAKTYSGLIRAALCDIPDAEPNSVLYEVGEPDWYLKHPELTATTKHKQSINAESPSQGKIPRRIQLAPMPDGRRRGLTRRQPSRHDESFLYLPSIFAGASAADRPEVEAKTRGTVMHAWFEQIEWLEQSDRPDPMRLREVATKLAMSETVINTLIPDFYAFLDRPGIRSVLQKNYVVSLKQLRFAAKKRNSPLTLKVFPERRFVVLDESAITQGSIDRLVLAYDKDQPVAADIVDYKTDRLAGDLADWIQQKTDHYQPQLQEYRRAVEHCFRIPQAHISARLVLLEADKVVDL